MPYVHAFFSYTPFASDVVHFCHYAPSIVHQPLLPFASPELTTNEPSLIKENISVYFYKEDPKAMRDLGALQDLTLIVPSEI
jgi:hypothetical protein